MRQNRQDAMEERDYSERTDERSQFFAYLLGLIAPLAVTVLAIAVLFGQPAHGLFGAHSRSNASPSTAPAPTSHSTAAATARGTLSTAPAALPTSSPAPAAQTRASVPSGGQAPDTKQAQSIGRETAGVQVNADGESLLLGRSGKGGAPWGAGFGAATLILGGLLVCAQSRRTSGARAVDAVRECAQLAAALSSAQPR